MTKFFVHVSTSDKGKMLELASIEMNLRQSSAKQVRTSEYQISGYVTDEQIETLKEKGYQVEVEFNADERSKVWFEQISHGRINTKMEEEGEYFDPLKVNNYWEAAEIEKYHRDLANNSQYKDWITRIELPWKSTSDRQLPISLLKIGVKSMVPRPGILFVGGMHADEWIPPEVCINFAYRLLYFAKSNQNWYLGNYQISNAFVKRIISELDIYVLSLANPEGREFSMLKQENWGWRKNRRKIKTDVFGVDPNRNFNFLWKSGFGQTIDPVNDLQSTYRGDRAESENEIKNIVHFLDSNSTIKYFVDIHSYGNTVLFPWSHDEVQHDIKRKTEAFWNKAWDGKRHVEGGYKEYTPEKEYQNLSNIAALLSGAIRQVNSKSYKPQQSWNGGRLFRMVGASDDYCFSRHLRDKDIKPLINAFTIECCEIDKPDHSVAEKVINEVNAGMFELCRIALGAKYDKENDDITLSDEDITLASNLDNRETDQLP